MYSPLRLPADRAIVLLAQDSHSCGASVTYGMVASARGVNLDGVAAQIANHARRRHFVSLIVLSNSSLSSIPKVLQFIIRNGRKRNIPAQSSTSLDRFENPQINSGNRQRGKTSVG